MRKSLHLLVLLTLISLATCHAEAPNIIVIIAGSSTVTAGQTVTYQANSSVLIMGAWWDLSNAAGHITSTSESGNIYTVTVEWLMGGHVNLRIHQESDTSSLAYKTITVSMPTPPPTPTGSYSTVINCGTSTVVTRAGTPAAAYNWYWQTSSSGTSTSNNGASYTVTSSLTLYLRSRRIASPFDWGSSLLMGTFDVIPIPSAPATSTGVNAFPGNSITISVGAVSGITTYHWYDQSSGGTADPVSATTSYNIISPAATTTYYAAAVSGTCESARKAVTVVIEPRPVITVVGGGSPVVVFGSPIVLTTGSYATYQWSNRNIFIIGSGSTCQINRPAIYYVAVTKTGIQGIGTGSLLVSPGSGIQQNENFIITNVLQSPETDPSIINGIAIENFSQQIGFFDGHARQKQVVTTQGSPSKHDLITPIGYDASGRQAKNFLPYVSTENNGWYKPHALYVDAPDSITTETDSYHTGEQFLFYQTGTAAPVDENPYSEAVFEKSALNRVLSHGAPGAAWQPTNAKSDPYSLDDKTVKSRFEFNSANEVVLFAYDSISGRVSPGTTSTINYYAAGTLHLTRSLDEHNVESQEFKDKEDRVICKKVQYKTTSEVKQFTETYYIYDIIGNLVAVLPPEAVKMILN